MKCKYNSDISFVVSSQPTPSAKSPASINIEPLTTEEVAVLRAKPTPEPDNAKIRWPKQAPDVRFEEALEALNQTDFSAQEEYKPEGEYSEEPE